MGSDVEATARTDGPGLLWSTCTGVVVAIHGEVDIATCDVFAAMVQAAIRHAEDGEGQREVHVDLGGLDFIGVSGARALVTAGLGRAPGHQLVVHRPPALLARILETGWGPLTGLRLEAAEVPGTERRATTAAGSGEGPPQGPPVPLRSMPVGPHGRGSPGARSIA